MTRTNTPQNNDIFVILITNHFPFGIGESFLENEFKFLAANFSKVVILTKNTEESTARPLSPATEVIRISKTSGPLDYVMSLILFIVNIPVTLKVLFDEFNRLRRNDSLTARKIQKMVHDLFKALLISRRIKRIVSEHVKPGQPVLLYSYWFTSSALATLLVGHEDSVRRIARAHRVDLYEEIHPDAYLPYQHVMTSRLDMVYPVSDDGRRYLLSKVPVQPGKVKTAKLGTLDRGPGPAYSVSERFTLVSCSFVHEVKRIDRIITSLGHVKSQIHWIHFGDGPLYNDIKKQAQNLLGSKPNISFEMRGKISNSDLMEFYQRNSVDVFINTSSSEGIPVTIMEALSFSVPVIALDVGGVREIVSANHGHLLPEDATDSEIATALDSVLELPESDLLNLRRNARLYWEQHYNAENNYIHFIKSVKNLYQ